MRCLLFCLVLCASSLHGCASGDEASSEESADAIVHGEVSPASEDAVVYIHTPTNNCTGTVIAPKVVLTARHCVSRSSPARSYRCGDSTVVDVADDWPASLLFVGVGNDIQNPRQVVGTKALVHEDTQALCNADVALLTLEAPVNVTPRAVRSQAVAQGLRLTAVGYGLTEAKRYPLRRLRRTGITVLTTGPVNGSSGRLPIGADEFTTGEAICFGDSGGPLLDAEGRVAGIISRFTRFGSACVGDSAMHADVTAHKELIARAIALAEDG